MEINKILSSDLLDIVFEGRNKAYGAYELRKTYNDRMMKAIIITVVILFCLITGYLFAYKFSDSSLPTTYVKDIQLTEAPVEPKQEVVIPPKVKTEPLKVEMVKNVVPLIVKDDFVPEDQRPSDNNALENARIGFVNSHGIKDDGIEAPPAEDRRGIISPPKSDARERGIIFTKVEIESFYPGGMSAWMQYLNKTFRYPNEAQDANLQGTVTVQFIVDTDGNVSDVVAISGPETGELREEAVRVIKRSGKWTPAIQNGLQVKSYKKQPITFKLEVE
jgi:protein TonB